MLMVIDFRVMGRLTARLLTRISCDLNNLIKVPVSKLGPLLTYLVLDFFSI